jgi:hypothetical protein
VLEVNISSLAVEKSLGNLARELGVSMSDMIVEQSRLTAQGMLNRTPPINRKMKISQAAGRGAIQSDLWKIFSTAQWFRDMGNTVVTLPDGRMVIRAPDSKRKARIISADRAGVQWNVQEMAEHHRRNRGLRSGRVMGGSAADVAILRNKAAWNRYAKTVYARMGKLAAGWLPALRHFASKSKISKGMKVPGFVSRQPNPIRGKFVDRTGHFMSPYAVLSNYWRYGYPSKMQATFRQVTRERELDAVKWMRKRLKKLIEARA